MKLKMASAVLFLLLAGMPLAATKRALPFIHDDYARALSEAKQKKLPIFVECWAPW